MCLSGLFQTHARIDPVEPREAFENSSQICLQTAVGRYSSPIDCDNNNKRKNTMALKRAAVKVEASSVSKSTVPVFPVAGKEVTRFNALDSQIKDLEAEKKELRAKLESAGLTKLFTHNLANAHTPVDSVKLQDEDASLVRLSFQDSYKAADADNASALFETLGTDVDINAYAHETVKAAFSDTAFLDETGTFSPEIFAEFQKAINAVAAKFKKANVLETKKLVQPKPGFHAQRWTDPAFGTVDKQFKVQQALPAKVMVVANVK